ncbi:MAG: hypothetical protein ABIL76_07950 [candidate division WOR-3 bacterium]
MSEKKYYTIRLTEEDLQNIFVVFDIALKSTGLQGLKFINNLLSIFLNAQNNINEEEKKNG